MAEIIQKTDKKTIYREGKTLVKLFNESYPKSDVLNDFEKLKVAVAYKVDGKETTEFPYEVNGEIVPVYKEFEGWNCNINGIRNYDQFPTRLKEYIEFIEKETGVPVKIVSVGPDREETIIR